MSSTIKYAVLIAKAGDNYSAHVPDFPGCIAAGDTIEETLQLIKEAIEFHIEGMQMHGEEVPPPTTHTAYVDVETNVEAA